MKKNILICLSAALLCLYLCSCSQKADIDQAETYTEVESTIEPTDAIIPEPTPEPVPEPVKVTIFGTEYVSGNSEEIDLSQMTDGDAAEVCSALKQLEGVKTIYLTGDDGYTDVSFESLSLISEAAPEAVIKCAFDLYGTLATDETEELRYYRVNMGNDCVELFRTVLPYLKNLKLLRLESCGITDYDAIDALRSEFPDKNIVWNVVIGEYSFMTDTTLVNCTILNDANIHYMNYLHDVKYLDFGHDSRVTNLEFVRNFPDLEVIIFSITGIQDLSPLADCPKLEFLECFSTEVSDLSPLSGLKELKYLNIGDCPNIKDLTPLYGMDSLVKVRICGRTRNYVTEEQILELIDNLPETCDVSYVGGHSANSGGWRFNEDGTNNERYQLLREQMQYDIGLLEKRASNSPSALTEP